MSSKGRTVGFKEIGRNPTDFKSEIDKVLQKLYVRLLGRLGKEPKFMFA